MTKSRQFVEKLGAWFEENGRDLLWRHDVTPYRVWVSEIMLQQTQVATVTPYFERWMKRFPTLESLAQADEADVLSQWSGLGYYRRARYLQKGAQYLVNELGGQFPTQLQELRKIPGIGAYTAGAIASIAMHQDVPAIDGNVERVLGRYFAIRGDLKTGVARKELESCAQDVAECGKAWMINQAMMDLGASLCGKTAACDHCPVAEHCAAHNQNLTHIIPEKQTKAPKANSWRAALVLTDKLGQTLIVRRNPELLLGSLWTFPMIDLPLPESQTDISLLTRQSRKHLWQSWLNGHGLQNEIVSISSSKQTIRHIFTHIDMHIIVDIATTTEALPSQVLTMNDIESDALTSVKLIDHKLINDTFPVSTLMKKLLNVSEL